MKFYEFNAGSDRLLANLAYANGFLPQTYTRALKPLLDHYRVISIHNRAMWDDCAPESLRSWSQLGDDLLQALDTLTDQPIVGIGHSFGGVVTGYAALKRPERFSHLILIDPVMLPPRLLWQKRLAHWFRLDHRMAMVQGTLRRRTRWKSVEEAYNYFKAKPLFARVPEDIVWEYASSITTPADDGGVRLAYSPQWEARIYQTIATDVWKLPARLTQPILLIRGEYTDTFSAESAAIFQELNPRALIVTVKGAGHLIPQEKPDETGKIIADFLGI